MNRGAGGGGGYSGRTRAFLARSEHADAKKAHIEVQDAETGETLTLNTITAVLTASSTTPFASEQEQMQSGAATVSSELVPTLTIEQQRDKTVLVRLIKQFQQKQMAEMIAREAQREALRRDLLEKEESKARRKLMKESFMEERLVATEDIKKLKLDQELALAAKLKEYGLLR